jgi:hypothetical protein
MTVGDSKAGLTINRQPALAPSERVKIGRRSGVKFERRLTDTEADVEIDGLFVLNKPTVLRETFVDLIAGNLFGILVSRRHSITLRR